MSTVENWVTVQYEFAADPGNFYGGVIRSAVRETVVNVNIPFTETVPQFLSGTNTGTHLHFSWQPVVPADHYEVRYFSHSTGGTRTLLHHFTSVTDNRCRLPVPTSGDNFEADVRAVHADGTFTDWPNTQRLTQPEPGLRRALQPASQFGTTTDSTPTIEWICHHGGATPRCVLK